METGNLIIDLYRKHKTKIIWTEFVQKGFGPIGNSLPGNLILKGYNFDASNIDLKAVALP